MGTEHGQRTGELDKERERLIKEAVIVPSVAQALAVFKLASSRVPYVQPQLPQVQFSTGANS